MKSVLSFSLSEDMKKGTHSGLIYQKMVNRYVVESGPTQSSWIQSPSTKNCTEKYQDPFRITNA